MYSRMWSKEYWIKLTKLLQENGYFVVSLGGNNDLKITNVDLDKRNLYEVRNLPRILDIFDNVITLNSGMLHIASINQDVKITYMNVGQFPAELIVPYRRGRLFHNVDVIEQGCISKNECFMGHITETSIRPQMLRF